MFTVRCGSECEMRSTGEMQVENNGEAGPQAEGLTSSRLVRSTHALTAEQRVIYGKEWRRTPVAKMCICQPRAGLQNAWVSPGAHTSTADV